MYIPNKFKSVLVKGKGRTLLANQNFKKGEVVLKLKGIIKKCSEATPDAVQIGDDKFIDSKHRYVEDHINHSCSPTLMIDFASMDFIALGRIKKGEELTYNYNSSEYDLVKDNLDFNCKCNSKNCIGKIKGFRYLSLKEKNKIKKYLSPFLKKVFNQQQKQKKFSKVYK